MANCSCVIVFFEQHVTVSDPFVLMRNCTSGIHSIDPAAIDVAKLSSACFSSIRLRTRVSFHRPTSQRLAPNPRMLATAQAPSRTKRRAIYRHQDRPCVKLRHPRNVPATTHKINMTSQSRDEMKSLTMRGWRVVRGFWERVLDCTPMKRRLAKSGGKVVVCRPRHPLDRNSRSRELHLFFYLNYRLNLRDGQH
jgi:hypothetical protein